LENARGRRPHKIVFFSHLLSADRGTISAETTAELEVRQLLFILGLRERTDTLVLVRWCSTLPRRC
jgi:hypothetical protein